MGYLDVAGFQRKFESIAFKLTVPLQAFFSLLSDRNRKPMIGMWEQLEEKGNDGIPIDKLASIYCGDAAGRPAEGSRKKDFSCSDRLFALNVGLPFRTPEELWYGQPAPKNFVLPKFNPHSVLKEGSGTKMPPLSRPKTPEIILMVGYPASGKSYFCQKTLAPLGYTVVSRDVLGTWQKCVKACEEAVARRTPVAVDNTNMDRESRARYIKIAQAAGIPIRCFIMQTELEHALHNEKVSFAFCDYDCSSRVFRVKKIRIVIFTSMGSTAFMTGADIKISTSVRFRVLTDNKHAPIGSMVFNMLKSKQQPPKIEEGFSELVSVPFLLDTTRSQISLYTKYLLEK
ncbi:putative polynucleotide kinase 3'-phosphatase [Opisthorchis viverrini]|uniref:Putative polynucleotide kinase 3'-phosphatase n=1 Tax=Opisthorchis viverrini TaxID=6198 RepID=A0A1S8X923_OPIVI|nr:putative polynucleotide kinase 3'-phosphatase [Opisthorchis viverrini]